MKRRILSLILAFSFILSSVLGVGVSFAANSENDNLNIHTATNESEESLELEESDNLEKMLDNDGSLKEEETEKKSDTNNDENKDRNLNEEIEKVKVNRATLNRSYSERDITSTHISSLTVDRDSISDGGNIQVNLEFNDNYGKIHYGDYIQITFRNSTEKYFNAYNNTVYLKIDGIVVGTAHITNGGARIQFNPEIEAFDQGSVSGSLSFTANGRNNSGRDDYVTIDAGSHSKNILIEVSQSGTTSGTYYYKTGHILPENPYEVTWFLVVNPDKIHGAWEDVIIHDEIQGVPNDQVLKKGSIRVLINGEYYSIETFQEKYYSQISVDYDKGIIDARVDQIALAYNNITITYETEIMNPNADYFYNNSTASYYANGYEKVVDGEFNHSVKNINSSANINGTVSGELKILKYLTNKSIKGKLDPIKNVEFKLARKDGGYVKGDQKEIILKTNQLGMANIKGLRAGEYIVKEVSAPEWIDFNLDTSKTYEFVVKNSDREGTFLQIENEPLKIDIPVSKEWIGEKTDSIEVELYKPFEYNPVAKMVLNEDNNWQAVFENIDKYDGYGNEIQYEIREVKIDGYESKVSGNQTEGFKITNTQIKKLDINVEKTWVGEIKDSVNIKLFADGKDTGKSVELSNDNNWKATFTDLLEYNDNGEKIEYSIIEDKVDGYKTLIEKVGNDFKITNISEETINIPVEKKWVGEAKEEVIIKLLVNNLESDKSVKLSNDNNWKDEFSNLPKYDETGKEIQYNVKEENIDGYTSVYTGDKDRGFTVTNTISEKTSIGVTKEWIGPKSKSVNISLIKNGETIDTVKLSENNNWQYTFENLDKFDENGQKINYNIREEDLDKSKIESTIIEKDNSFKIINKNIEKVNIPVEKKWIGKAMEEVEIKLLADNKEIGKIIKLSNDNNWKGEFSNLPKYSDEGSEIKYTVIENQIDGYETEITGNMNRGYTVINTIKETEKINLNIEKIWEGPKLESIEVYLLNGDEIVDTIELSEDNNWKYTTEDLEKYDENGNEIKYSIDEKSIEGYAKEIKRDGNNFTIVNTKEIPSTSFSVVKEWQDFSGRENNKMDGIRPVEIQLIRGTKTEDGRNDDPEEFELEKFELNKRNNWRYDFENLPLEDEDGNEYYYYIHEIGLPGFISTVHGEIGVDEEITVVNKLNEVEKISIPVNKIWKNQYEIIETEAPDITVTIVLKDDKSEEIERLELNNSNKWAGVFEDIPKYRIKDNGKLELIKYHIEEIAVDDYKTEIQGNSECGYTVINTSTKPGEGIGIDPKDPEDPDPKDPDEPIIVFPKDPEDPKEPENPDKPTEPTEPEEPVNPDKPTEPTEPVEPVNPDKPTEPTKPVEPVNPDKPTEPTKPVEPVNPDKPTEPTKPVEPVNPDKPTEPTKPVEPENPDKPTEPTEPEEPVNPNKPTDPTKPVEPINPEDPVEPKEEDGSSNTKGKKEKDEKENDDSSKTLGKKEKDNSKTYGTNNRLKYKRLPKTGVSDVLNVSIIGVLLSTLGTFLFRRKKK